MNDSITAVGDCSAIAGFGDLNAVNGEPALRRDAVI